MSQTFQQRRAIRAYCAHQRTARSEHRWTDKPVVCFPTAPAVPGSDTQPFTWADSLPFLVSMLVVASLAFYLHTEVLL